MKILKQQNKQSQKTIMLFNKDLVNLLTDEEACIENTTPSVIIENCILTQLLPTDESLKKELADAYIGHISIQQMLINIFNDLGKNGKNEKRKEENRELVNLLYEEINRKIKLQNKDIQVDKACESFINENMKNLITQIRNKHTDDKDTILLCDVWDTQSKNIPMGTIHWYNMLFDFLLSNWGDIYSSVYTYKVLSDVCSISNESVFKEFPLYELRKILQNIEKQSNGL